MISTQKVKQPAKRVIGLYGGSFDPPHLGHLAVLQDLLSKNLFAEIWLVPVFAHPFGKSLTEFEHRLNMLKILCAALKNAPVKICEIEKKLPSPSYTLTTVQSLKQEFPDLEFQILVGSDVKDSLAKWHKIEELKKIATFYFFARSGFETSPYPQISSSEIRDCLRKNKGITDYVSREIEDYIVKNRLYK